MTPAWYQRMTQRERRLAWIVAGAIVLLINLLVWSKLFNVLGETKAELAVYRATRAEQEVFIKDRDLWERRDKWIREHQPVLKSAVEASTLLDQIKQIAGKHNVVIENPAIGTSDATPERQAVFASFEVKSPWPPLVKFLYDVQQPESFVVFDSSSVMLTSTVVAPACLIAAIAVSMIASVFSLMPKPWSRATPIVAPLSALASRNLV